jgi:hypothetical protein
MLESKMYRKNDKIDIDVGIVCIEKALYRLNKAIVKVYLHFDFKFQNQHFNIRLFNYA